MKDKTADEITLIITNHIQFFKLELGEKTKVIVANVEETFKLVEEMNNLKIGDQTLYVYSS